MTKATMTAEEFWRPIINDFNPVGYARRDEVRKFYVDRHEADPARSLMRWLKSNFLNSVGQQKLYKALMTGHLGSGKSSELIRLGEELAEKFFVVHFDAELSLASETANHFDIILGMGLALHLAAQMGDLNPSPKLATKLVKSMASFIRKYEERKGFSLKLDPLLKQIFSIPFIASAGALGGPLIADAASGLIGATRLELNVRDELVRVLELPPNKQEIIGALNDIIAWVQKESGRPVLIIVDGLDKVSAFRARLLFADSSLLMEPACALIYAAPIEFYHRMDAEKAKNKFDSYKMLTSPAVHKRPPTGDNWRMERDIEPPGIEILRKVVMKRLESRDKLGDEIITPEALALLARASAGVMREMIRSFQDAATSAQLLGKLRIDEAIALDAIKQQEQEIALRLTVSHREVLRLVLQQGALSGGKYEAVEDELLHNLCLLSYQDSESAWFDTQPGILRLL